MGVVEAGQTYSDLLTGIKVSASSDTPSTMRVRIHVTNFADIDGDGIVNEADRDDDNDQILDEFDCASNDDSRWTTTAYSDLDQDRYADSSIPVTVSCYGAHISKYFLPHSTTLDNCPGVSNDQKDLDSDGLGDDCDLDIDGDGHDITKDCAIYDSRAWRDMAFDDSDGDGVPTAASLKRVSCFGEIPPMGTALFTTQYDNCPLRKNIDQLDSDGDGIGDICELDWDGDGVFDELDCDRNDKQKWRRLAYSDHDRDGIRDSKVAVDSEVCFGTEAPLGFVLSTEDANTDNCISVYNPIQEDTDRDGIGDVCDADVDNDGVSNYDDCAQNDPQRWAGRAFLDSDHDSIRDNTKLEELPLCFGSQAPSGYTLKTELVDNCPYVSNSNQSDVDDDGVGDACDIATPTPQFTAPAPTPNPTFPPVSINTSPKIIKFDVRSTIKKQKRALTLSGKLNDDKGIAFISATIMANRNILHTVNISPANQFKTLSNIKLKVKTVTVILSVSDFDGAVTTVKKVIRFRQSHVN